MAYDVELRVHVRPQVFRDFLKCRARPGLTSDLLGIEQNSIHRNSSRCLKPPRNIAGRDNHQFVASGFHLNDIELQAALNPAGDRKVERFGWTFAPGDKVMQIENDYEKEVYNGDIGTIDDVDSNSGELIASFDGRSVTYGFGELDMLVPAYAATIHKSQGSEYPAVIIPVLTQHYAMLQRNLLYTGVTRGKKLVVLVGQKKAVAIAVRNVSGRKRWSKLSEWLRPKPPVSRQFGMAS